MKSQPGFLYRPPLLKTLLPDEGPTDDPSAAELRLRYRTGAMATEKASQTVAQIDRCRNEVLSLLEEIILKAGPKRLCSPDTEPR